jgi:hypothetical protein
MPLVPASGCTQTQTGMRAGTIRVHIMGPRTCTIPLPRVFQKVLQKVHVQSPMMNWQSRRSISPPCPDGMEEDAFTSKNRSQWCDG